MTEHHQRGDCCTCGSGWNDELDECLSVTKRRARISDSLPMSWFNEDKMPGNKMVKILNARGFTGYQVGRTIGAVFPASTWDTDSAFTKDERNQVFEHLIQNT